MPVYHFHSADGVEHRDPTGTDLPSVEAAQLEAIAFAGEVLRSKPQAIWKTGHWRVEVTDDDGQPLFTIVTLALEASQSRH